jgi:hypothetical protein
MYKASQAEAAAGGGDASGGKPQDDKVVDATFEEVDERKNGKKPN